MESHQNQNPNIVSRREFLQLLAAGVIGHTLDVDKLLWVPGQKTIFLPSVDIIHPSISEIVALELERMLPKIKNLFERDDAFYKRISHDI